MSTGARLVAQTHRAEKVAFVETEKKQTNKQKKKPKQTKNNPKNKTKKSLDLYSTAPQS